jgi:hypothetical protein
MPARSGRGEKFSPRPVCAEEPGGNDNRVEALPFIVFGCFLLLIAIRARREGLTTREWLAARNAQRSYVPGWWKPMAILVPVVLAVFIGRDHGSAGLPVAVPAGDTDPGRLRRRRHRLTVVVPTPAAVSSCD